MAWQPVTFKLKSDSPMLMNNGQSADPLNQWAKAKKQISGKRQKTDSDHMELARLDFRAALYMGPEGPVIPAQNIDAMLIEAAKKNRKGMDAKSGLYCPQDALLLYDGPHDAEALWEDERFRHKAIVRVQNARLVRTRPIFPEWQSTVTVNFEDSLVNPKQVEEWFFTAGRMIGLGDWRPRHGRFSVEASTQASASSPKSTARRK